MKKDLKHLWMPSQKWKNSCCIATHHDDHPILNSQCDAKQRGLLVFNVKNQDTSLDIVLTLGAMNVTNMVISSWTAHTKYLLPEHQCHITRHTKVTMPDQTQGTTRNIKKDEAGPDHSPTTKDITA